MISNEYLDRLVERMKEISEQPTNEFASDYKDLHELLLELKERRETELRPATKFLSCGIGKQLNKIQEEFKEVESELAYERFNKDNAIEELVDLQTACETMLAILGLDEADRADMRRRVIAKNAARGYYE